MTWTSKTKDLSVYSTKPHPNSASGLVGRAPGITKITFGPLDLFGAAARCGHLSAVNPALVTPESQMISALVEQYVDDVGNDFAILPAAANFKDFVKSYFSGTVASGLAYLALINDGYVWSDHFENAGGGNSNVAKSPDFVFASPASGVALVESKGTRSASILAFDRTVDSGYIDQVEPHLGFTVGGAIATHGYCVGAWLTSTSKAELLIHHTAVPAFSNQGGGRPAPVAAIQRQNYATAFALAHSDQLGRQLGSGGGDRLYRVPFTRLKWRGRSWLTGAFYPLGLPWRRYFPPDFYPPSFADLDPYLPELPLPFFAIEERIAKAVLHRFLMREPDVYTDLEIEPIGPGERFDASIDEGFQSGVIFPDGLAVIRREFDLLGEVVWDPLLGKLHG